MVIDAPRISAPAQLTRGALAALVAVGSAALAHAAVGHHSPHLLVVVLALAVSVPVCVRLSGKALSLGRLAGAVLGCQVILHGLFGLFPASTVGSSGLPSSPHAHHGTTSDGTNPPSGGPTEAAGWPHLSESSAHNVLGQTDTAMVSAHLLAALTAFGLLRFGETLAHAIVELLSIVPALTLCDLAPVAHIPPERVMSSAQDGENVPNTWLGSGPRSLRGPPALVK
ncbi:hypothetical protein [Nesterenkonia haasae]|uniref:hypothetical protein n=1 Tax=Nesterenkonia haasae TaxID=2587813 RepID=UPI0013917A06|nr:hypothetical protein [Nesterenkonia haasae]NDK31432.1 hypothetical protein [Nesterenkonia haasae]